MKIEKLTLNHQKQVSEKLNKFQVQLSEYSFSNLYLFRTIHHYELLIEEELFIKGVTRDHVPYLMPLFKPTVENLPLIEKCLNPGLILFPIPQEWLSIFPKEKFEVSYNEDDSDYLYDIQKLASFEGRHLSKKRNLVKQFLSFYGVESRPLISTDRDLVDVVIQKWSSELQEENNETDNQACLEALQLLERLNLNGKIYFVKDEAVGFILGEWLNPHCYVIHFEKALKSFKGLYQFLLQDFSKSLSMKDGLMNLEQDLGLSALRQSKHSYRPDRMGHKMRLKLIS
jgi:hypothetical protein